MTETMLGRIQSISFGFGGYQGAQFGVAVSLELNGGSVSTSDFRGAFPPDDKRDEPNISDDKRTAISHTALWILSLLVASKKQTIDQLVGVPIEATFDRMRLQSWRILTEVL